MGGVCVVWVIWCGKPVVVGKRQWMGGAYGVSG